MPRSVAVALGVILALTLAPCTRGHGSVKGWSLIQRPRAFRAASAMVSTQPQPAALSELLEAGGTCPRFVLVGGKGGVGKTSTAASMAIRCADEGLPTLVVSTDPAHSLGDALELNLSGGGAVPVPGCDALFAMEVDPSDAIERFRSAVTAFRPSDLGLGGLAETFLDNLGLNDFADILDEPPPGLDELLALSEVVELTAGRPSPGDGDDPFSDFDKRLAARGAAPRGMGKATPPAGVPYARVVLDTAPTGHTLRLLSLPTFLDSLINKLLALRSRLGRILTAAVAMGVVGGDVEAKIEQAALKLAQWQARVASLKELLVDAESTNFCVVTVPTEVRLARLHLPRVARALP